MQQDQPVPASFTPLACLPPCLHFRHGLYSLNCKLKWPFAPWSCFLSGVCHRQEKQQRPQCPRGPEKSPQLTCFHKNSFRRHLAKMCGKAPLTHKLHPRGFQGGRQKMWGSGDLWGCMAPSSEQLFIHLYSTWTQPRPSCPRKPSKRYRLLLGTGEWEGESHPWEPGLAFLCCSRNPGLASLCLSRRRVLGGRRFHMHPWAEAFVLSLYFCVSKWRWLSRQKCLLLTWV